MINTKKISIEYLKSIMMLIVPLSILAIMALSLTKPATADWLAREDGLVENISAFFLFAAAVIFVFTAIITKKKSAPWQQQ